MSNKSVSVARTKTKNVQRVMRDAQADLRDSNSMLAKTSSAEVPPAEAVQAALAQNVDVEEKLHEAVQELEVVGELLKVAEAKIAGHDDQAMSGRRSGVGLESVMEHMAAAAQKVPARDLNAPVPLQATEPANHKAQS